AGDRLRCRFRERSTAGAYEQRALQVFDRRLIVRPLAADLPGHPRSGDGTHVDGRFPSLAPQRGAVQLLLAAPRRGRTRNAEDDVHGMRLVVRQAGIRALIEEPKIDSSLDFLLTLGLEIGIATRSGAQQTTETTLRRLRDVAIAAAEAA